MVVKFYASLSLSPPPFRYGVIRVLPVDSSQYDILSDDIPLD